MANAIFKKSLIIFILMLSFSVLAQKKGTLKKFSDDFPVYLVELGDFMSATDNSDLKSAFKTFKKKADDLTALEKALVISISDKMLKKRLRAKPHFFEFLSAVVAVDNHKKGESMLLEWLNVVEETVKETTTKKLVLFFSFTKSLVAENTLRSSKSANWNIGSAVYNFKFEIIEPVVVFVSPFNLSCSADGGSYEIKETKGRYYFISNEWIGENGVLDWECQGMSKDSVYVEINSYKIDTRKSLIVADSSVFWNKYIFNKPITGEFINKVARGKQSESYPKFTSYSKNIELKDIFSNIDYRGGYKMNGKEFIADGGDYAEAKIVFKRNGKDVFIANAKRFSLKPDRISSQEAGVKIYFDEDSIYHSNLQFKYINSKRQLQLYRKSNSISGAPMLNTYHNVTMDFELLQWDIDEDIITFGSLPGTAESRVEFESVDRYLQQKFESMQGIDAIHPLFLVNDYVEAKQEEKFFVEDFARFSKFPMVQMQHYLIQLANDGFIFYDFAEQRITVLPKLYNYINAASEIGDYDVITFSSLISEGEYITPDKYLVNAALNLSTKDLNIVGIHKIELSKERGVLLYPKDGLIVIKKNRDFVFNGHVYAGKGRLNLFGRKFFFHYDEFKVDLNQIDSVQLSVPVQPIRKDMYGNEVLTPVRTVIEAVTGDLRIDDASNKSGVRKDSFPEFPIFRSFEDSYAYYDRNSIYDGVYHRDRFSFHLQPFAIDSLDNYTGKGLWFAGVFESSGIFPTFDDTLRLQEDYSLGFTRKTPPEGFDIYGGKGKYNNNIHLSHNGLKGNGEFEYLTLKASSEEIFFFPDSANFHTQFFALAEVSSGVEFPDVKNTETYAHFEPYNDRLEVVQTKEEFKFYNSQATFKGDLLLQPIALSGGGLMSLDKANVTAEVFTFNANWFGSEDADLQVFDDSKNTAIKAINLRSHIDLALREGLFYSNGSNSYVEFPANKYISYIDKLRWAMDDELFTLGNEVVAEGKGSDFVSIHPNQDSLMFTAKTAIYSLKDYIINTEGVDEILVADAIVFPDSGIVTVAKNAVIQTLFAANITVDDLTQYHKFTNATVDIKSAHSYTSSGDYTYKDALNNKQQIFFKEISVGEDTITIARGDVGSDKVFHIDSNFDFKGSVDLIADKKNLTFDGFFMANHSCILLEKSWIKFRSEIDPKNVLFTLDEKIYNDENDLLSSALVMNFDSTSMYSTFLNKKKRSALDFDILSASYSLRYDKNKFAYVIGGLDSLSNYYTLYDKTCMTKGEGIMDFNLDLGQLKTYNVGSITHDMKTAKTDLDGFFMLDFFFSDEALAVMGQDLYDAPGDDMFEYDEKFSMNLKRVLGNNRGEVLLVDLEMKDDFSKFPEEMKHSIVFAKTNFKWDDENKAFISKGSLGVGSVFDKQVNSLVDGYIIIEKGQNSDVLTIYMETEFYDEYYFQYKNGVMRAWSTNPEFNAAILSVPDGKRKAERAKGAPAYRYMLAPEDITEKFLKKAKKKY